MALIEPVVFESRHVHLLPLRMEHEADIWAVASDGQLWKLRVTSISRLHAAQ